MRYTMQRAAPCSSCKGIAMIHDTFWLTASDRSRLFVNQWLPAAAIESGDSAGPRHGRTQRLATRAWRKNSATRATASTPRTCVDMAKLPKTGPSGISPTTMAGARWSATWPASTSTSASSIPACRSSCSATAWAATSPRRICCTTAPACTGRFSAARTSSQWRFIARPGRSPGSNACARAPRAAAR